LAVAVAVLYREIRHGPAARLADEEAIGVVLVAEDQAAVVGAVVGGVGTERIATDEEAGGPRRAGGAERRAEVANVVGEPPASDDAVAARR
jgi:hypothetical protein